MRVRPRPAIKKARGSSANSIQKFKNERLNYAWTYDFVDDQTNDASRLKWFPILDQYLCELRSNEVERSRTAPDAIDLLKILVRQRGVPGFIRSENGSEFVANAI